MTRRLSAGKRGTSKAKDVPGTSRGRIKKTPSKKSNKLDRRAAMDPSIAATHHGMKTRSRAKYFKLFDLPAELRNHIYSRAFVDPASKPIDLEKLELPPQLSREVSHKFYNEALPIFFKTNAFKLSVRSNFCIIGDHFHSPQHIRYEQTGLAKLSPLLKGEEDGPGLLPEHVVRFTELHIHINCVFCKGKHQIGLLKIKYSKITPHLVMEEVNRFTREGLQIYQGEVQTLAVRFGRREHFNGLTVEDVVEIANAFRHDDPEWRPTSYLDR